MTQLHPVSDDPEAVVARIERRFDEAGGHARLESELRRLATDVLGRCDQDALDPACRDAVARMTRAAVAASVEPLVARFIAELARGMVGLAPEIRERLLRSSDRRDLGFE